MFAPINGALKAPLTYPEHLPSPLVLASHSRTIWPIHMPVPNCFSSCCEKTLPPEPFSAAASLPWGDLNPVAYAAGVLEGKPLFSARIGDIAKRPAPSRAGIHCHGRALLRCAGPARSRHLVAVCRTLDLRTLHAYLVAGLGHDFVRFPRGGSSHTPRRLRSLGLPSELMLGRFHQPDRHHCDARLISTEVWIVIHIESLIYISLIPSADSMGAPTKWTERIGGHAMTRLDSGKK